LPKPAKAANVRAVFERLRGQAAHCRNCELWQCGTQTVFGKGAVPAELMFVGEQPGDQEDRAGEPFVGPAGRLLDRAFEEAAIDRKKVYVTNAVKHFRWEARGKRRIHKRPGVTHIKACRPWLDEELAVVHPRLVVCLGAVAAQSLLGGDFRLTKHRGEIINRAGLPPTTATAHPSSILRAPDDQRDDAFAQFVGDLRHVQRSLRRAG
jgi:uracil-DNA glycosylase